MLGIFEANPARGTTLAALKGGQHPVFACGLIQPAKGRGFVDVAPDAGEFANPELHLGGYQGKGVMLKERPSRAIAANFFGKGYQGKERHQYPAAVFEPGDQQEVPHLAGYSLDQAMPGEGIGAGTLVVFEDGQQLFKQAGGAEPLAQGNAPGF